MSENKQQKKIGFNVLYEKMVDLITGSEEKKRIEVRHREVSISFVTRLCWGDG